MNLSNPSAWQAVISVRQVRSAKVTVEMERIWNLKWVRKSKAIFPMCGPPSGTEG